MEKELIKLTGIYKSFAGVQALQNVDFTIREGEVRCLAGENGSGKSTLIKVIAGFYEPDSGSIEINGKTFEKLTPKQAIREGVQIIYQDFAVFPNLTVAENIAITSEYNEGKALINWKSMRARASGIMQELGIDLDPDAILGRLSVADKQLVAICRALVQQAKLLIMDEPTTALTKKEVSSLFRLVLKLREKGIAILFVSHKLEEVFEIAETITILRNGKLVTEGAMRDFDADKFVYYMTGRTLEKGCFAGTEELGDELLCADRLSAKTLFEEVSFKLYSGEVLGITGLLGSGRSELAKALFGMVPLSGGEIRIADQPVRLCTVRDAIRSGISYVPEDRLTEGLFLPHSISRNIAVGAFHKFFNRAGFLRQKKLDETVRHWIDELKIVTPSGELPAQALSGGNQQKVVIAKWLENDPKILILNSPTVGVDIGSKADIHACARKLARQGMGVIIISDDISEIMQNCSRVLVMKKGRIVSEHKVSQLTEAELSQQLRED